MTETGHNTLAQADAPLLVVQHRLNGTAEQKLFQHVINPTGVPTEYAYSLLDDDKRWGQIMEKLPHYRAILSGGFSDFDRTQPSEYLELHDSRMSPFMEKAIQLGMPLLAVCGSHQSLNEYGGGKVRRKTDKQEIGTVRMYFTNNGKEHPVFKGAVVSEETDIAEETDFLVIVAVHKDHAATIPSTARVLGWTKRDDHAAIQIGSAVGMQKHPELPPEYVEAVLEETNKELIAAGLDPYIPTDPFSPRGNTEIILVNLAMGLPSSGKIFSV